MELLLKPEVDDGPDLVAISRLLLRYRWLVVCATLLGGGIAGFLAFTAKPYFQAEVLVTDVREHGLGDLGSLASQLGGLASLAGVSFGQGNGTPGQQSAAMLESHYLAEEFITRYDLIPVLLEKSSKPRTLWLAVKYFTTGVITIRKDQRKGITTVGIQWTDPAVAARWANEYVALANEILRKRALDEATRNIAYLNQQLARTDSVDLRRAMYNLIENETKSLMVANGRVDYAFEVVDPAVAPELKAGPHRLLNTLLGLIGGFALGAALAFVAARLRGLRREIRAGTHVGAIV
jgi:uncharacterized protein involved in exopolysaccharide biosynthesis